MNLDGLELADAMEFIDATQDTLDEVWKQDEHKPYLEVRMQHLLESIAGIHTVILIHAQVPSGCLGQVEDQSYSPFLA